MYNVFACPPEDTAYTSGIDALIPALTRIVVLHDPVFPLTSLTVYVSVFIPVAKKPDASAPLPLLFVAPDTVNEKPDISTPQLSTAFAIGTG